MMRQYDSKPAFSMKYLSSAAISKLYDIFVNIEIFRAYILNFLLDRQFLVVHVIKERNVY